jgi:hypothetical protein
MFLPVKAGSSALSFDPPTGPWRSMEADRRQEEAFDVVNAQKYLGFSVLHSFINQN